MKDLAVSVDVSVDAWECLGGAVEAGVGHGRVHRKVDSGLSGNRHVSLGPCGITLMPCGAFDIYLIACVKNNSEGLGN